MARRDQECHCWAHIDQDTDVCLRDEELFTGKSEKQKHCSLSTLAHPAGPAPVRAAYKNKI